MNTKKSTEGVGKKIVEALKKQATPVIEEPQQEPDLQESDLDYVDTMEPPQEESEENNLDTIFSEDEQPQEQDMGMQFDPNLIKNAFPNLDEQQQFYQQQPQPVYQPPEISTDNVKILGSLINQLPAGISKQMGAHIIKQTMEALGISMKTVLTEAQQMQEHLSEATNDCLNSIQQYKQQIQAMEKQVQQYHKQYNSLNELISLFVQTGI